MVAEGVATEEATAGVIRSILDVVTLDAVTLDAVTLDVVTEAGLIQEQ
jgi:hypothetical protein